MTLRMQGDVEEGFRMPKAAVSSTSRRSPTIKQQNPSQMPSPPETSSAGNIYLVSESSVPFLSAPGGIKSKTSPHLSDLTWYPDFSNGIHIQGNATRAPGMCSPRPRSPDNPFSETSESLPLPTSPNPNPPMLLSHPKSENSTSRPSSPRIGFKVKLNQKLRVPSFPRASSKGEARSSESPDNRGWKSLRKSLKDETNTAEGGKPTKRNGWSLVRSHLKHLRTARQVNFALAGLVDPQQAQGSQLLKSMPLFTHRACLHSIVLSSIPGAATKQA
jgi:hypothetical protein